VLIYMLLVDIRFVTNKPNNQLNLDPDTNLDVYTINTRRSRFAYTLNMIIDDSLKLGGCKRRYDEL
jgi:hypothetical protein